MQPDPSVLSEIYVEDLSIQKLLSHMNQKISVLYDREHTIGHAYFMPLKNNPTVEMLASIFLKCNSPSTAGIILFGKTWTAQQL